MPPRRLPRWIVPTVLALLGAGLVGLLLVRRAEAPAPAPAAPAATTTVPTREVIGYSAQGREIEAFTYGSGPDRVLLVGGIHGGYEWNSTLLAYRAMDELARSPVMNPPIIPDGVSVTVVPTANPDGLFAVIGKEGRFALEDVPADEGPLGTGRFNANGVDLNRNFDCKWQPEATWRGNKVSAGTAAFSEPEARAIRDLALRLKPEFSVFWHSQANAVYASECEAGILPATRMAMETYGRASGYTQVDTFDAYPVTGDVEGWLASVGLPAITVELATHATIEWEKNAAGLRALLTLAAER